jgi:voltage-gated potassium channel
MKKISARINRSIRQGLISSGLLALAIMVMGGLGFWWIDPRVESFNDGIWLAFTTAATVGYGDLVPSTHASRIFAVVVVLLGLAVLSLVTASISAIFVQQEEREVEHSLLQAIHASQQQLERLEAVVARLEAAQQMQQTGQEASTTSAAALKPSTAAGTPQ